MHSFHFAFEAIGTKWLIDCYDVSEIIKKEGLLKRIKNRIEEFDKVYSRFREDSLVSKIAQEKGIYKFPPDSKDFFAFYKKHYKITNGKFTLLIGNTLSEAGYDSTYSLKPGKIAKVPAASSIYSFDYPFLTTKKPHILDFGGLGKGYLIDIISNLLLEEGIKQFCVDGGGDMFCNLRKPIKVGLENPNDPKQVIGVAEINNQSICASSGNRRRWDKFHHIIDPKALESPTKILASWVVAKDAITSDGLATCLFLVEPWKLEKYFDFEYLVLYPDMTFKKSDKFPAQLFLS